MTYNVGFKSLPLITSEAHLRRIWCHGKRTITPGQRVWVRYMLNLWGSVMGGDTCPGCSGSSVIGRLMMQQEWDQDSADRIIHAVNRLHEEGLRGEELFRKARELVIPQSTTKYWLEKTQADDDAEFIERVIVKTLRKDSPMYAVAVLRHCSHLNTHRVAVTLAGMTGTDVQAARKRIVWCEKVLEEDLFYAMRRELRAELTDLQNGSRAMQARGYSDL
ncbi:DUF1133 family protein [Escherichia fergusonii]|uniref:DUF1133 family protein n=1 Tax=Escherichia fergusonii TaxID=564 RepID=UPI0015EA9AC1|nr:DUF1133 family protein [Escherichia coli]QMC78183.1 DUF1133 family protein [Escherichia fergusonii]HCO7573130.1 DUF1133 family protein [Escherichia fergusonii]